MKKIRIAQIGIGHDHAGAVFQNICSQHDNYEVAGYAVPETERKKFNRRLKNSYYVSSKELSVDEILTSESIDAVTIETEEINLTNYACRAANAGKHIHMDKPGGLSLAEFETLVKTQKSNGKVLHLGYMYRYNPYVIDLLRKVKAGELGTIHGFEAQMNCYHTPERRQWLSAFPGGIMFFLGCHLVDLSVLFRGFPKKVIPFNRPNGDDGVTGEDYGLALLEYDNGYSIIKTDAEEYGGFARRQIVVVGSKGTVEIKPIEHLNFDLPSEQYAVKKEYYSADWHNYAAPQQSESFGRYTAMMEGFAAYVRGEKENPYTYDYELELYKTVLKSCGVSV